MRREKVLNTRKEVFSSEHQWIIIKKRKVKGMKASMKSGFLGQDKEKLDF